MQPGQAIVVRNSKNENLAAPVEIWLGVLLTSLPDEWLDDVFTKVKAYTPVLLPRKPNIEIVGG